MGGNCCHNKGDELAQTAQKHRHVLWLVLWINALMFGIELVSGLISGSVALVADSLDMFGDAVTYGTSIAAVGASVVHKAKVAKLKAWVMLAFGLAVSIQCIQRAASPAAPDFIIMLGIGGVALLANLICLYLLSTHKEDDINMRSVWICSRNDIIANVSVLAAGAVVFVTKSGIPDLVVGAGLAILFTKSAFGILKDVSRTLEQTDLQTG